MKKIRKTHKWLLEHEQFLKDNIKGRSRSELTKMINEKYSLDLSMNQVKSRSRKLGIKSGLTGRFEKGVIPYTKGLTWDEFLSEDNQEKLRKTQFKKGERPLNWNPIGTERIDSKDGYVLVKVQNEGAWNKRWRMKHYVEWEKIHGPVPENKRFIFSDGDRSNCSLENLRLVHFGVGAIMNNQGLYIKGDSELMETAINTVELMRAISDKSKKCKT